MHEACEAGADVNEKFTEDIDPQHSGMTALALASALNRQKLVKVRLKKDTFSRHPELSIFHGYHHSNVR